MATERHELVSRRAREIWEREGRPEGRAEEHWRLAEAELQAQPARNPGDEARPGSPQTAESICPDCNGEGRRDGGRCQTCGGTGRVVKIVGDA